MVTTRKRVFALIAALILLINGVTTGGANNKLISNFVFSGGGSPASQGDIRLNSTIGQPVSGRSTASKYSLNTGYWSREVTLSASPSQTKLYLPFVLKE